MQSWASFKTILRKLSPKACPRFIARLFRLVLSATMVLSAFLISGLRVYSSSGQTQQTTQQAADVEEVMYGRPALGQITDNVFQQQWLLLPNSKDRITISVERTGDTFVPEIELHDAQDNVLVRADHDSTFARAAIVNFTLPAAGRYTVVASRFDGKAGKTYGAYKLVVSLLGAGLDGLNMTVAEGQLQLGQSRDGTLMEAKWQETWAFQTQGADPVTVI